VDFSYWERKYIWKNWDYLIIGSGITGISAAIHLKRRRPKAAVVVIEKGALPTGASTKNAGFACFGSVSEILDDLNQMSDKDVFTLIQKRYEGLKLLRQTLGDEGIAYDHSGGFEIFMNDEQEVYETCLGSLSYINAELVNAIGRQAFWDAQHEIEGFGFKGVSQMLVNKEEGLIDTGLMMTNLVALARQEGVEILNGVEVLNLTQQGENALVETNLGPTQATSVLVATNGFARNLLPDVDAKPCRAQVLITSQIKGLKLNGAFHHDRGYNYFRHIDGRVLLGGGRHQDMDAENTSDFGTTSKIQHYLEKLLHHVILPDTDFTIEQRWSGIMGMGNSKEVILKQVSPSVYCAVRFGGMGVALGSYIGREAAIMIANG
jgi:glycine/D-amino acid oxidase-like deaminating enzyme